MCFCYLELASEVLRRDSTEIDTADQLSWWFLPLKAFARPLAILMSSRCCAMERCGDDRMAILIGASEATGSEAQTAVHGLMPVI